MKQEVKIALISASIITVGIVSYYGFRKNGWFRKKNKGNNKNDTDRKQDEKKPPLNSPSNVSTSGGIGTGATSGGIASGVTSALSDCSLPIKFGQTCKQIKTLQQYAISKGLGNHRLTLSDGSKATLNERGGADGNFGQATQALFKYILGSGSQYPQQIDKNALEKLSYVLK